ncbi:MAG: choice-of-anchor D domain-containing protein, partial [Candidatus Neomarinimicrobiota bacterium]
MFLNGRGELEVHWDTDLVYRILEANESIIATSSSASFTKDNRGSIPLQRMSADDIWQKRQANPSPPSNFIYAVVLDGIGTWNNQLIWDELNANWPIYGETEILIDYATFHDVVITYEGLVTSGADLLIISDNWNPDQSYGPFSDAEVMAIAQYVEDGAGLYISGGTFNNGEYPELQAQVDYLAPLVGLSETETYYWNYNEYGPLYFVKPTHPLLVNITEPFESGFNYTTVIPSGGTWTEAAIPTGDLIAISGNGQTALVVYGNRIYHSALPEGDEPATEADKQFIYNVLMLSGAPPWLAIDPRFGTIPAGSALDIGITFDATGMEGGDYDAGIMVASNDPANPEVRIPAHLHVTGAPDIAVSEDTLDYESIFVGYPDTCSFLVANKGAESLVVSSIVVDNPAFTVDTTTFVLSPRESQPVAVTFSPASAGIFSGTLTITSDDPDEPSVTVALIGESVEPPVIAVSPDSLGTDLFTGDSIVQMLTISNLGTSELYWEGVLIQTGTPTVLSSSPQFAGQAMLPCSKEVVGAPPARPSADKIYVSPGIDQEGVELGAVVPEVDPDDPVTQADAVQGLSVNTLETILDNLNTNYSAVTDIVPNRFDFSEGVTGNYISDGGNDMYDGGNYLFTDLGGPIPYSNGVITTHGALGTSGRYFTRKYPGLFVFVADLDNVDNFEISGYLGADGSGYADGAVLEMMKHGVTYYGFVKRVYGAGDPSVNHLVVVADNPTAYHEFSTNTNDDYHRVCNLSGSNRIYYLLYAGSNGYYINNTATLSIMDAFLDAIHLMPDWIAIRPDSGTIAPGGSENVEVIFNATGLSGGDYEAQICVISNAPANPEIRIPANLHVTGAPDIAISADSLDVGPAFVGWSVTDTLVVSNVGSRSLIVSGISSNNPVYTVDITAFGLFPGESQPVAVTFAPSSTGIFPGTLTIASTDPNRPSVTVALRGEGVEPPVIAVSPDSLSAELYTGDVILQTVTITNSGLGELAFDISTRNISYGTPASGAAGASVLNGSGFSPGLAPAGKPVSVGATYAVNSNSLVSAALEALQGVTRTAELTVDGKTYRTFTEAELARFKAGLGSYYQAAQSAVLPRIAVVGDWAYDILYELITDSALVEQYVFIDVYSYYDYSFIEPYDALVICEDDADITLSEATSINMFYHAGKPVILGMDDLDDNFDYYPGTDALLKPVFGITDAYDGDYYWGYLNPDNPITEGIDEIHLYYSDNDWYLLDGADWIFAGSDDNYYGVSYEGQSRTVLLGEYLAGWWWEGNRDLIANAINWMMQSWLSVSPQSGTVAAGSSIDVEVTFDATHINPGSYRADMVISSNDPANPEVWVPTHLQVTGASNIAVSADTLDYGIVFIGWPATAELVVSNNGTDSLTVSNIVSSEAAFTVDTTSFILYPGESQAVVVTFAPTAVGVYSGALTITNNDPDESSFVVRLLGKGLYPPVIAVSPDSLSEVLSPGDSSTQILTIDNSAGESELIYEIIVSTKGPIGEGEQACEGPAEAIGSSSSYSSVSSLHELLHSSLRDQQSEVGELPPQRLTAAGSMISPGEPSWRLLYTDPDEPDIGYDIQHVYGGVTQSEILFKLESYTPLADSGFFAVIVIDADRETNTGWNIDADADFGWELGVDYIIFASPEYNEYCLLRYDPDFEYDWLYVDNLTTYKGEIDSTEIILGVNRFHFERFSVINLAVEAGYYDESDLAPDPGQGHITFYLLPPWLRLSAMEGVVPAGNQSDVTVTFNAAAVQPGHHRT